MDKYQLVAVEEEDGNELGPQNDGTLETGSTFDRRACLMVIRGCEIAGVLDADAASFLPSTCIGDVKPSKGSGEGSGDVNDGT